MTAERGKAEAAVTAGLVEEEGNENKSDRMLTEFLQERSNGLSLSANLEGLRVSRSRGLGALKV